MKKIYSSYVLNFMSIISFIAVICLVLHYKDFANTAFWVVALLFSFLFIGLSIIGYLIERTIYLSNNKSIALNFPYENIPCKIIYYILFYLGLVLGSSLGFGVIIALPIMLLFN